MVPMGAAQSCITDRFTSLLETMILGPQSFLIWGEKRRPWLYNHPDGTNQYFGMELVSGWPDTLA